MSKSLICLHEPNKYRTNSNLTEMIFNKQEKQLPPQVFFVKR